MSRSTPKLGEVNKTEVVVVPFAKGMLCQLCSRKSHSTTNCYQCLNITRYPLTHGRKITLHGLASNCWNGASANLVSYSTGSIMSMWYLDSRATSHISTHKDNIHELHPFNGNDKILTAVGSPFTNCQSGRSCVCVLLLQNLLF